MMHWYRRLVSHIRGRRLEDELRDEIEQHIELRQQSLIDDGMAPEEAGREARRLFGNAVAVRQRARDERGFPMLTSFLQDLRFGARIIARHPGHAAAIVLTIALGAGLNGALSLAVNAAFMRSPVLQDVEGVVRVDDGRPLIGLTYPDYVDYRDRAAPAVNLAAFAGVRVKVRVPGSETEAPHVVFSVTASGNYFDVLRVRPILGRTFTGRDDLPPFGTPVVVLGEAYWARRLNRDPGVIGRTIELNLKPFTIIGVVPAGFRGIDQVGAAPYVERIWIPLWTTPLVSPGETRLVERNAWWGLQIAGRLQPGTTLAQARQQIATVAAELDHEYPGRRSTRTPWVGLATDFDPRILLGEAGAAIAALGTATLLILLIAAANVAGLMLARAGARTREVAVRLSLGASPSRIVRQFLTESLILSAAGVGLGFLSAYWLLGWLITGSASEPLALSLVPDRRVAIYGLVLAALVATATGIAPAMQASRTVLLPALKDAEAPRRNRLRGFLVGAQVAACLVFLVLTGLLLRAAHQAQAVDPLIDIGNLLSLVDDDGAQHGYDGPRRAMLRAAMQQRVEQLPAVSGVALANPLPFSSNRHGTTLRRQDTADATALTVYQSSVSPLYFEVTGLPLLQGRTFSTGAADEIIVNQTLAGLLWGTSSPLGERVTSGEFDRKTYTVVGVVRDAPFVSLRQLNEPFIFLPLPAATAGMIVARTRPPARAVVRDAETALQQVDSRLAYTVRPLGDGVAAEIADARMQSRVVAAVGALALLLSLVGIWSVAAQAVVQRTREIGVRVALGADNASTIVMIVRGTLVPVALGAAIGLLFASGLAFVLRSKLYGVRAYDPLAFAGAVGVLLAAATIAAMLPARRAARVDPLIALRSE